MSFFVNYNPSRGDMKKKVYDEDNNSVVDISEGLKDVEEGIRVTAKEVIDAIVLAHEHNNKEVIDLLANVEGKLYFNDNPVSEGGDGETSEWEDF